LPARAGEIGVEGFVIEPPTVTGHLPGQRSVRQLAARRQPRKDLLRVFDIRNVIFDISTGAQRRHVQFADRRPPKAKSS
jgi:hypothetical protein